MSATHSLPVPATRAPFEVLTATAIALLGMTAIWSLFDPRLIAGDPVWLKPAKFAVSFVVQFGTLALIVRALSSAGQGRRALRWAALAMSAAFTYEMAYMIYQAAQAEPSHFNHSTPFHVVAYQLMGMGAVVLIAAPIAVAWVARTDAALGPATRAGIWWGALVSFALTLVVAGYLSSGTGHFVGTPSEGAATLPFFGWSAEVGDLRPAHFLALHALQALPLFGLWLDRRGQGAGLIRPVAAVWAVLTLALFAQALMGMPLIRL